MRIWKIEPEKKYCQNRMIFTKPGIYAATVILLDPLMSACNVRYSFIIKVLGKSKISRSRRKTATGMLNFRIGDGALTLWGD